MAETYDFIIVGGGTAGLVLANRLTEDPKASVLVLEAGVEKDQDPRVMTPGLFRTNAGTDHDWAFTTVPQDHLNGRVISHMQGKMLGGTSSLNALALVPPSVSDLDAWETLGNEGWNWHTMKPYLQGGFTLAKPGQDTQDRLELGWMKKSWETNNDTLGLGGPVKSSFTDVVEEGPSASAWVKTIKNLGYPLTDNPFDGASIGPYSGASTIDPNTNGRVSSSTAYYQPIKTRPNLHVQTASEVRKIVLEESEPGAIVATGVLYTHNGEQKTAKSSKEVILSAGVFQSPKLLELSGIGDPEVLSKHGIETKVGNKFVGTNLQDHIMHSVSFETVGSFPTRDSLLRREPEAIQAAMLKYKEEKAGPFSSSAVSSFAYLPIDDFVHDTELRDQFLAELSQAKVNHPIDVHRINFLRDLITNQKDGTSQYFPYVAQASIAGGSLQEGNFVTFVAALSHPLSSGTVHIASSEPSAPPSIDHKYLSNPLDVELQARHVRYLEKIAAAKPYSDLLKKDGRRNTDAAVFNGDLDKVKEYLKLAGSSNYHSVGTCAMAPREAGGVVDAQLRVYGVQGLRVVDASVMPLVPQSNTQNLVYGIAERAARIIKGTP